MNLIPMGGKTPTSTAAAVAVDASGNLETKKIWETEVISVPTLSPRSTSGTSTKATVIDCSEWAMVSVRVFNNMVDSDGNNVTVSVMFQVDDTSTATDLIKDVHTGETMKFNVPRGFTLLMPDDIPFLKYVKYLKFYIKALTTPVSGGVTFTVFKKR